MNATAACLPVQLSWWGSILPTSHQRYHFCLQKSEEKVGNNSSMTTAPKEWQKILQESLWKLMSYFRKSHSYFSFTSDFKNPPANSYATYLTVVGLEINGLKFQF